MLVAVQSRDRLVNTALPSSVGGARWITDAEGTRLLYAEGRAGRWRLEPASGLVIRGAAAESGAVKADPNQPLVVNIDSANGADGLTWCVLLRPDDEASRTCATYAFEGDVDLAIGRAPDNDLVYNDVFVSAHHLGLSYAHGSWTVVDFGSANGVFVNGWRIPSRMPRSLAFGDVVSVLGLNITLGAGFFSCNNPGGALRIPEGRFERYKAPDVKSRPAARPRERERFYPALRFARAIEPKRFEIDPPPAKERKDTTPVIMRVGPSLVMGIAALASACVFVYIMMGENATPLRAVPLAAMAVAMLVGSVLWPILNARHQRKEYDRKEDTRKESYSEYLSGVLAQIGKEEALQRTILEENRLPVQTCLDMATRTDAHLMDRTFLHADYLDVRIGLGDEPFEADIQFPDAHFSLEEDELREAVDARARQTRVLRNVPVAIPLIEKHVVGVVGRPHVAAAFVRGLVVQLAALCSYGDVKIAVLCDETTREEWEFAAHLPHCFTDDKSQRLFACGLEEASEVGMFLERVADQRRQQHQFTPREAHPYYVVVCASERLAAKTGIVRSLADAHVNRGISLIALAGAMRDLPKECRSVVVLDQTCAYQMDREDPSGERKLFVPDVFVSREQAESFAFSIAKVRLDLSDGKKSMPSRLGFLEMFGAGSVEHLNIGARWRESNASASLACRVGVDAQGEPFLLNLHERFHGPHGLIAGTTGSGKSEFLITYILSMAITYSPADVSFLLIDYKGGGLARAFDNGHVRLPHLAGTVTNLDGAAIARCLVSIHSELKRRQELFNRARDMVGGENIDIYDYLDLYRQGRMTEPCPHLFIIADEFAELKQNEPEFMDELISAARIGRSLGVHLVLATQKPSGVVNAQIWSNARFKVCLKVADAADSNEVIKRPDAAELQEAGRFYLLVGYNEHFALGQAAYAGVRYVPRDRFAPVVDDAVVLISNTGRALVSVKPRIEEETGEVRPESVAVIAAVQQAAEREGLAVRQLWLDPVAPIVYADDLAVKYGRPFGEPACRFDLNPLVGEYDNPARQRQGLLSVPLTSEGNALVYGASDAGVETMLAALLYSLVRDHDACSLNIYVLDFGSESLRAFAAAPQVGDVIGVAEEEKLNRFFGFFEREFARRRALLAPYGGSFERYASERSDLCGIVVVLNDVAAIMEAYPQMEERLTKFMRETGRSGVYLVATTPSPTSIRVRQRQCFRQIYACNLADVGDYASIFGGLRAPAPVRGFARGLARVDDGVYEFQAARLAHVGSDFDYAVDTCRRIAQAADAMGFTPAPPIPVSPESVDVGTLARMEATDSFVPYGLYDDDLSVAGFDFAESPLARVQFQRRKDGVTFARAFLDATALRSGWTVAVLDEAGLFGSRLPDACAFATNRDVEAKEFLEDLMASMGWTSSGEGSDGTRSFDAAVPAARPLLVVVTGVADFLSRAGVDAGPRLRAFLRNVRAGAGVYVLLVDASTDTSYVYEDWFKAHLTTKDGLWIGPGVDSQTVVPISFNHRLAPDVDLRTAKGYAIEGGAPRLVHVANGNYDDLAADAAIPFTNNNANANPAVSAVAPLDLGGTAKGGEEDSSSGGFYFVLDD